MDNLYPNDGSYFTPRIPADQEETAEKEKREVTENLPLIGELLEHLEARIEFYQSVDSIPDDVTTKPDEFMHTVAANKLTKENLESEHRYFTSLLSEYVKK